MTNLQQKLLSEGLTLKNYKEPLKAIPKSEGFGYYGTIMGTIDGQQLQCHMCGRYFAHVGGHVQLAHKMKVRDYKERFQLAYSTALISESEREKRKNSTILWRSKMTPQQKEAYTKKTKEAWLKYMETKKKQIQPALTLETKNKRGTCPDQLLDKIREVAKKLGHTPSKSDFTSECGTQRYFKLINKVYGSWKNALKILGMTPNVGHGYGTKTYSNEELLEYLSIFYKENDKIPTYTDFKRGLLPTYNLYVRRFGSIVRARGLANIPIEIENSKSRGYGIRIKKLIDKLLNQ